MVVDQFMDGLRRVYPDSTPANRAEVAEILFVLTATFFAEAPAEIRVQALKRFEKMLDLAAVNNSELMQHRGLRQKQ